MKTKISIVWTSEDVAGRAKDIGIELTSIEVCKVMKNMERMHDAAIGINWDVIDARIEMFAADREK